MARGMPCSRQSRPMSLTGWTVPMTFEAWLTMTSRVFFLKAREKSSGIDETLGAERNVIHFHAVNAGELVERAQDGIVLEGRGDGVVSRPEHAGDDQVQGVRGIVAETQAVGVRPVKKSGQEGPGLFDHGAGFKAEVIPGTAGVDAEFPVEMIHEIVNFDGLGKGRGPVVEEDQ